MKSIEDLNSSDLEAFKKKFSRIIKEIRKRLVIILVVFLVAAVFGFIYHNTIIKLLLDLLALEGVNVVFTSPFQYVSLAVGTGAIVGFVAIMPMITYQILTFLKPALNRKEFRTITRALPYFVILFIVGFVFGVGIMRWQIEIFLHQSLTLGIGNILDISGLLSTILFTATVMGFTFQFPIVLLILMRIGIVKQAQLAKKRLWVYLGSFFLVMLLPTDNIIIDVVLALPLIFLFESAMIANRIMDRNAKKRKKSANQKAS